MHVFWRQVPGIAILLDGIGNYDVADPGYLSVVLNISIKYRNRCFLFNNVLIKVR